MPWLRVGDTSITHPIVLRALELEDADERTLWELFGFATACATHAAAHKTDYIIELGTIRSLAGLSQAERLIESAIRCGYFTEVEGEDGRRAFKLVDDEELFHMRLKEDIEWEKRQRNDTRNTTLTVPVRRRDGDACRWCGKVVYWGDQKSPKGATYDHLKATTGAESPDDMVVSCRGCNSSRKNEVLAWAGRKPLAAPKEPRYGKKTTTFLAENGIIVSESSPETPGKGKYENFKSVAVTPAPVDPNSVDPTAVEPETPAPAATGPEGTAPGKVEPSNRKSLTPQEVESAFAEISANPTWEEIEQWSAKYPELSGPRLDDSWHPADAIFAHSPAVEPETPAPAEGEQSQAPWDSRAKKKADLSHSERLAISRASDLDMPGRVGTGRDGKPKPATPETKDEEESQEPSPRKRRRRRRR